MCGSRVVCCSFEVNGGMGVTVGEMMEAALHIWLCCTKCMLIYSRKALQRTDEERWCVSNKWWVTNFIFVLPMCHFKCLLIFWWICSVISEVDSDFLLQRFFFSFQLQERLAKYGRRKMMCLLRESWWVRLAEGLGWNYTVGWITNCMLFILR